MWATGINRLTRYLAKHYPPFQLLVMQGMGDYVADLSKLQLSESGLGDSPSRNKLEKLAQWRINPSLIKFPQDAREFHGGFATVSQGLLTPSLRSGGTANKSEQITDEHSGSKDRNLLSVIQKRGEGDQGGDEEADGRTGKEHGNLRDFLASGEWEIPERISLIHDVTLGLEYLHSREPPIYHGDLKSLNILVDLACHALITDFGSARHLGGDQVGKRPKGANEHKTQPSTDPNTKEEHITLEAFFSATASTLTLTGSSYTLRWAAPELLQDEGPRLPSDIWALGWIAYEVMTNTIPFHDIKKDAIVINHVIQGHLPSVTEHARMSLIRALCSLMVQCWSINPDKRPTVEECRKVISWMPRISPAPAQAMDEKASQLRHAQMQNQLGHMYRRQANFICALNCFKQALEICTNHNDREGRADTLCGLADAHRFRHELTEALKLYSEALDIYNDLGLLRGRAFAMFGLAETHRFRREYGEATRLYMESLQIYTDFTSDQRGRATTMYGLAEVHRAHGEYNEAIKLYSEAMQIYTDIGDWREKAITLHGLAEVYLYQNKYREATNLHSEALQIFIDFGDHKQRAKTLRSLAEVHWSRQEYSEARKLYSEALQVYTDIEDRLGKGIALWGLAEVHRVRHEYNEAIKLYPEATKIFTDLGDKCWIAETLTGAAGANRMQGQLSSAISLYIEASENFREIGDSMRASNAMQKAADIRKTLAEATADPVETVEVGEGPFLTS
ncbi:hypothetical protein FS837_008187 [Tulasnella sp. UAMH 9824]|nr:hypothetical protein FS837_008187 [Tulasnella sp. UAMH 9824]